MKVPKSSAITSRPLQAEGADEPALFDQGLTLRFFAEKTTPMHLTDRVGTYGSLHFAEVI